MQDFTEHRLNRRQVLAAGAAAGTALVIPALVGSSTGRASASAIAASSPSGTFKALSWESTDEMKKWKLEYGTFFKTQYPRLKLQIDYGLSWDDYWTKLQTTIAGGASPDLCWMHDTRVQAFASLGLLTPLDSYISRQAPVGWQRQFYPSQVKGFQYGGKQYALPYDWASGGWYVNLDLLKQAGVSIPTEHWTFDDLLKAALKIQKSLRHPSKQWAMSLPTDSFNAYFVVRSFGGDYFSGNPPKTHFTDPNTVKAFQYLYDAMWKYKVMPTQAAVSALGGDPGTAFANGNLALLYTLDDAAFSLADVIKGKFRWTVAPTPRGPAKRFQFVGGSGFAIPKGSHFPDVAYQAMRYVISEPKNLPMTAKMGSMFVSNMAYAKYNTPPASMAMPAQYKHTFYDLGKRDACHPNYVPQYAKWDTAVYTKDTDSLWTGQATDVQQVMEQLQSDTEALFQGNL